MQQWAISEGELVKRAAADPAPGGHEVVVRTAGVGVNRADLLQVRGHYPAPPGAPPDVPGLEFSGVVEATGGRVTDWRPGDRVMGLAPGGAYAERLTVPAAELLPVPPDLDLVDAAGVPEPFLTAWAALTGPAALGAGEWLGVRPGTAAVGQAAAQIATMMGAGVVVTSRDPARLTGLPGSADWHALREGDDDARDTLFSRLGIDGLDAVIDMLGGGGAFSAGLALVRPGARWVGLGLLAGVEERVPFSALLARRLSLGFMTMRTLTHAERAHLVGSFRRRVLPALAAGRLAPLPVVCYAFADAPAALDGLRAARPPGRIVLDCG